VYQEVAAQAIADQLVASDQDFLLLQFLPVLIFSSAFLQM